MRILYLEDDRMCGSAIARHMRSLGLTVALVDEIDLAMSILPYGPWDVVISDFQMAKGDGVEFMRAAARAWPEARRLMLTGHPDHPKVLRAISDGVIEQVLAKPIRESEIRRALQVE